MPDDDDPDHWKDRDTVRITVDLTKAQYIRLQDGLTRINEVRPDDAPKVKKTHVLRGLIGSWTRNQLPHSPRNYWR